MTEKTDEELVLLVQHGEVEPFGELVARYEAKITRYARKFLFDREDTKDLVQEVFLKAYVNIQSFDASQKFSPWIYRIAHNEFVNLLKKKERLPLAFFDPDAIFPHPLAKETADDEANRKELKAILDQSLNKLDSKYREPLVLYYYEDMNYEEIAEVLQLPASTIGVRLKRAKAVLKKIMPQII